MDELIMALAGKYPVVASIFMVIGVLRAINKPLFAFIQAYVDATPSKKDDALLAKVKASKVYSYMAFFLDWSTSVKLSQSTPPKK